MGTSIFCCWDLPFFLGAMYKGLVHLICLLRPCFNERFVTCPGSNFLIFRLKHWEKQSKTTSVTPSEKLRNEWIPKIHGLWTMYLQLQVWCHFPFSMSHILAGAFKTPSNILVKMNSRIDTKNSWALCVPWPKSRFAGDGRATPLKGNAYNGYKNP